MNEIKIISHDILVALRPTFQRDVIFAAPDECSQKLHMLEQLRGLQSPNRISCAELE